MFHHKFKGPKLYLEMIISPSPGMLLSKADLKDLQKARCDTEKYINVTRGKWGEVWNY